MTEFMRVGTFLLDDLHPVCRYSRFVRNVVASLHQTTWSYILGCCNIVISVKTFSAFAIWCTDVSEEPSRLKVTFGETAVVFFFFVLCRVSPFTWTFHTAHVAYYGFRCRIYCIIWLCFRKGSVCFRHCIIVLFDFVLGKGQHVLGIVLLYYLTLF